MAHSINMTPFQTNTAALFVPRDSALSRVELLTRDMSRRYGKRQDELMRDEQSTKETTEPEHGFGKTRRELAEGSTTPTKDAESRTTERNSRSLQWVSLTSQKEVELHLNVRTPTHDLGSRSWLTILFSKGEQQFRTL